MSFRIDVFTGVDIKSQKKNKVTNRFGQYLSEIWTAKKEYGYSVSIPVSIKSSFFTKISLFCASLNKRCISYVCKSVYLNKSVNL